MSELLLACAKTEEIRCFSYKDPSFGDVLRLRALALPAKVTPNQPQDEFDKVANIYLMRQAGKAVLSARTVPARATETSEMEGLYPPSILQKYRPHIMHTSKLVRCLDTASNPRQLIRFMSYIFAKEYASGIRITFATSPLRYLPGYQALGFAIVKNTSFSLLETGDESRLIVQPAIARWRSPFTEALGPKDCKTPEDHIFEDVMVELDTP